MKAIVYSFDAYISVVIALIAILILINYYSVEANYIDYYQLKILSLDVMRVLIESGSAGSLNGVEMSNILANSIPPKYYYKLTYETPSGVRTISSVINSYRKFKVVTTMVVPVIDKGPLLENPYSYKTCQGGINACSTATKKNRVLDGIFFSTFTLEVGI